MAIKNQDPKQMRSRLIGNVLLLVGAGLLIFNFLTPFLFGPQIPRVPYSLFIHEVKANHVSRVSIAQDQITYQLRGETSESGETPNQILATTPIFDLELPKLLEQNGVEFAAAPIAKNNWFGTLLGWVIPPLIFVGIFQLFSRGAGGGGGAGGLQIGKSKAKVYVEGDSPKVLFSDVAGVDESKVELEEIVKFLKTP